MPKKWNQDEVYELFKSKGHEYTGTYTNSKGKLPFICGGCKKGAETMLQIMQRDSWIGCRECGNKKGGKTRSKSANSHETISLYFEAKECELLTQYENCFQDLEYRCHCGNTAVVKYKHARRETWSGCSSCSHKFRAEKRSKKDVVHQEFEQKGCRLVSDYKNCKSNLHYICRCGNSGIVTYETFSRDEWKGCKECFHKFLSETQRSPREEIENLFESKYCILIGEYKSMHDKVDYICKCGEMAAVFPSQVLNEDWKGCRDCSYLGRSKENIEKFSKIVTSLFKEKGFTLVGEYKGATERIEYICKCQQPGCFTTYVIAMRDEFAGCEDCVKKQKEETNMERYGCRNPMQNPEIFERCMKAGFKYKEFEFPSGRISPCQGYEHFALEYLLSRGIQEVDIFVGKEMGFQIPYFFQGQNRLYYPDIFIKSENLIVEVKSRYTLEKEMEKNKAKMEACVSHGYKTQLLVFERDGTLKNKYSFLWNSTIISFI